MSDLIEKIKWLQDNDSEAKKIGQNGKDLFLKLYNMPNMIEDSVSIYSKYASLMKYIPEKPDKKFRWKQ
jgi:hypothetical protein